MPRARVYIQPLANASGVFQDEVEITQHVLPGLRLTQRTGKNKWTHGLLAAGQVQLALSNPDGRYSNSGHGSSMFAMAGADGARVRVAYPWPKGSSTYSTMWRGLLTSKAMRDDPNTRIAHWTARTPDSALREAKINPGVISQGMTARQMIEAVFTEANVAAAMPNLNMASFYDANPAAGGGTQLAVEEALLGTEGNAVDVLQALFAATDSIFSYLPWNSTAYVARRGSPVNPFGLPVAAVALDVLGQEEGVEQVFNQVVVKTGITGPQATYEARNEGSISRWGLRTLELDLEWLRNFEKATALADNLVARLARPQRVLELELDGWNLGVAVMVGQEIAISIPTQAADDAPAYGRSTWNSGARYPQITRAKIEGSFYLEEYSRNLDKDTMRVRLRDLN